jgi:hypothetical protein
MKVHSCAIQIKNPSCIQQKLNKINGVGITCVGKTTSYSSIGTQIGQIPERKPEIIAEEEGMRLDKKMGNCMFTFC